MPGVDWIAAGLAVNTFQELTASAGRLAKTYLRRGERFWVGAEPGSGAAGSDAAGAVTSAILSSVRGVAVSEEAPKVRFRAVFEGTRGVLGVELRAGPGGVPTGTEEATCLVSGGIHSLVVAWSAVVAGFRVRLVHAESGDDALLAVARLYSELSHRADPRALRLEVAGGRPSGVIPGFLKGVRGPAFTGFTAAGGALPAQLRGLVGAPLYLLPERRFESEFESLGVKAHEAKADWTPVKGGGKVSVKRFGGVAADVSGVLDGLA
jgi:hypothetical protein